MTLGKHCCGAGVWRGWALVVGLALGSYGAGAEPVPAALPPVLLASPVNATWAADHVADWARRGIRGFLFDGIMADIASDVWAVDGDPATRGTSDGLLQEIRAANGRLRSGGVDQNFLETVFLTDRPYFSEPALWSYVEGRFTAAGQFCRLAGLRGIAIDCQVSDLFYQYDWDGYRYKGYNADDVGYGAAEFGSRIITAFLRENSRADILLIANDWQRAGPLWLRMLEGMVSAVGHYPQASIHLLIRIPPEVGEAGQFPALIRRNTDILRVRFDPATWKVWTRQGTIALGVGALDGDGKRSRERCRALLAAAKVFSPAYVWIDDPDARWWRMAAGERARYQGLRQKTPPPKNDRPDLASYTAITPVDGYARVGQYPIGGTSAYILRSDTGAAAYLWRGSAGVIKLDHLDCPVTVLDVAKGTKTRRKPVNGAIKLGPFAGPTVLDGLPVREFLVPASLWVHMDKMANPRRISTPFQYGFVNRTQFRVRGTLSALVPARLAIEPPEQPFSLDVDESATVNGALQGRVTTPGPLSVGLSVAFPGAPPLTRRFEVPVAPALSWSATMLAPVWAAPVTTDFGHSGPARIVACDAAGEVRCFDTGGATLWRRRFPVSISVRPVVGRHWDGSRHIAVVDDVGQVHVLKPNGVVRWEFSLDGPCSRSGIQFAQLHPFPGDELVAGLEDGRICAYIADGFPYWKYATHGRDPLITVARAKGGGLSAVVAVCASGQLFYLEHNGVLRWRAQAAGPVACAPLVEDYLGTGAEDVITASRTGIIQVWDAANGVVRRTARLDGMGALIVFGSVSAPERGGPEFFAGDGATLVACSHDFRPLWRRPIPCVASPAVFISGAKMRIVTGDRSGRVTCLNRAGKTVWSDSRSAGPILSTPVIFRTDGGAGFRCLYGSTDGLVRCLAGS